jgi:hypothetical protein
VFASGFSEGDLAVAASSMPMDRFFPRREIIMDDDCDVVHNVLYYLYTNTVRFYPPTEIQIRLAPLPPFCDAEDIYALAHRLDLAELQSKALHFLKLTCTKRNITERALSSFAALYEQVGTVYDEYFKANWQELQKTDEYEKYFQELASEGDVKETSRVLTKFRGLFKQAALTEEC